MKRSLIILIIKLQTKVSKDVFKTEKVNVVNSCWFDMGTHKLMKNVYLECSAIFIEFSSDF